MELLHANGYAHLLFNGMIGLVLDAVNQMVNYRLADMRGPKGAGKETLGSPNNGPQCRCISALTDCAHQANCKGQTSRRADRL